MLSAGKTGQPPCVGPVPVGAGVGVGLGDTLVNWTEVLACALPAVTPSVCCPAESWGSASDTENVPLRRLWLAGDCASAPSHVKPSAVRPGKPVPVATTVWPGAPAFGETLSAGTAAEAVVAKPPVTNRSARPTSHVPRRRFRYRYVL